MISFINEKIYDMTLISKTKKQNGPEKLKKIINNLRKFEKDNLKGLSGFKIEIFKEKKEEINNQDSKISAPIIGFQYYFENFKKSNSKTKSIINNDVDSEKENSFSIVNSNVEEETKQIDSSDFSEDE